MEVTLDRLFATIGRKQVEIEMLREQIAKQQAQQPTEEPPVGEEKPEEG